MTDRNRPLKPCSVAHARRCLVVTLAALCVTALLSGCMGLRRSEDGSLELVPLSEIDKLKAEAPGEPKDGEDEADGQHPDDTAAAPVGTPFQIGSWEVTVVAAEELKKLPNGKKPKEGKRFLAVEVRIMNVGTSTELNVKPSQFSMTDPSGEEIAPYKAKLAAFNAAQVRPIPVSMGSRTTFVYHVPKGSTGYVFSFQRKNSDDRVFRWEVP